MGEVRRVSGGGRPTGDSFGIPFEVKDGRLRIEDLPLKEHPLLITFRE